MAILSGCSKPATPIPSGPPKISIVATAYPLADIARQVAGPVARYDWIVEEGQNLDAVDPTPEILDKIRRADMVLTSGFGEEWAVSGFDDPMRGASIVRLDVLSSARADTGSRQLWLDPAVAKEFASVLAERLISKRPEQAQKLRENAAKFAAEIDQIWTKFAPKIAAVRGTKVLVLSTDYSAMSRSLGLVEIRPVTRSPLRLTDDDIRALREAVRTESPAALLVEVGLPPALQQDLGQRLGIPVMPIDSLGTSAGVGRNTYQAILRYNLQQIASLGAAH
jgi:ABC-type Zn uptake system ZnuABC Zn-binding protein ZnuA